ncbi:phosphate acyltransferase, partial [Tetragenococcus halophilus]|uniref:phosphate acyltransferase n=1 Tax=Tetragenococcus halophilus TaxID=51669 RepID=UPI0030F2A2A5
SFFLAYFFTLHASSLHKLGFPFFIVLFMVSIPDLALSKEAVESKRFNGPIAGDADVLVVPNIDVGNTLYKSLVLFGQAIVGGMIIGTTVPIVVTSRSDSANSKLIGLELALDQLEK